MSGKKKLNQEELKKVSGGVSCGDQNIVECQTCGTQFDPDTVERKLNIIEESEDGSCGYETFKCPTCNEFRKVKVIQFRLEEQFIDYGKF